jgi:hypothetical protein
VHAQHVPFETFTLIIGCPQCEQVGRCFVTLVGRALRLLSAWRRGGKTRNDADCSSCALIVRTLGVGAGGRNRVSPQAFPVGV